MSELLFPAPERWEVTTLGNVCAAGGGSIQTGPFGSQLHASDYVSSGTPSVMPQNIGDNIIDEDGIARIRDADVNRLSRFLLKEGDIVYSRRGDVTRRALIRREQQGWLCGTGCLRVRIGSEAIPQFVSYYLGHPRVREWITRHAVGATMLNLNTKILSALPVILPPRSEQYAIAGLLGSLDDKIAVNHRIITGSKDVLQALSQSIFIAKSRQVELREIVELRYGKALKASDRIPGDIPVFGGNGASGSHYRALVSGPGIIVGRKGANAGSVSWSDSDFWPIDTAFYVIPRNSNMPMEFLYLLLRTTPLRGEVGDSAIPGLNRDMALSIKVWIPDVEAAMDIAQQAHPHFKLQEQVEKENRTLAEMRDGLLPKLMSGEVRIRDAEKVVEDAV
ncbi:restriction endonuclease subunit S [Actinomadura monticuli]|uniref:Restriction endonuclease subunit S n=1 Tax=Actinomadura monticuli TaxID=3097367 RepID=A0ABV4Q5P5_9ACTN